MRAAALLLPLLLFAAACRSLEITPAALAAPAASAAPPASPAPGDPGGDRATALSRADDRAAALARWQEAVGLMNEFLASSWRLTLPQGRFELDAGGMTFFADDGRSLPISVASTWWGDLVVASGFRAQEGEDGFCVGEIGAPDGEAAAALPDPLLDNTFFRYADGDWHDAASLAELTLHETTHVWYRTGTIGPWNTIGYYVVAVVTFSASTHSAEDRPRATSEEFAWFRLARTTATEYLHVIEQARDEHLAAERPHCEHGPFGEG